MAKVLVILGHSNKDSLCAALAEKYTRGAQEAGHEVELLKVNELRFDPILRLGYRADQKLETDLEAAQVRIRNAQHLVWVYPIWWGTFPALLKGFIDRVFVPGFAFRYQEKSPFPAQLLVGRTAQLLVTSDTPAFYFRWIQGNLGLRIMRKQILGFCGIRTLSSQMFGPVRQAAPAKIEKWLTQAYSLGKKYK